MQSAHIHSNYLAFLAVSAVPRKHINAMALAILKEKPEQRRFKLEIARQREHFLLIDQLHFLLHLHTQFLSITARRHAHLQRNRRVQQQKSVHKPGHHEAPMRTQLQPRDFSNLAIHRASHRLVQIFRRANLHPIPPLPKPLRRNEEITPVSNHAFPRKIPNRRTTFDPFPRFLRLRPRP